MTYWAERGWTIQHWTQAKPIPGWFAVENLGTAEECCVGPLSRELTQAVADEMNELLPRLQFHVQPLTLVSSATEAE